MTYAVNLTSAALSNVIIMMSLVLKNAKKYAPKLDVKFHK